MTTRRQASLWTKAVILVCLWSIRTYPGPSLVRFSRHPAIRRDSPQPPRFARHVGRNPNAAARCGDESACKPGSVPRAGCPDRGDGHPSRVAIADDLQRPTRVLGRAALGRTLSGLAPGGVYRADPVTRIAGGLLHHRFTLTATTEVVEAVCFLWHCPAGHPGWLLATTLPCGARTFLDTAEAVTQPSGRLIRRAFYGAAQVSPATPRPRRSGPVRRWRRRLPPRT